jgi:GT2 family glycosyltransferase
MSKNTYELISALICTRDRGDSITMTMRSVLSNVHPLFELIVVDQSKNSLTEDAMKPFLSDGRVRYIKTETTGLGSARNIGLANSRAGVVVMTDDDCEVPPNWLVEFSEIFRKHPKVAVAFCTVTAAPHDPAEGFVPTYERAGSRLITTLRGKCRARGIGAGMAVRREVIHSIGGFDEMLGAGAFFPSCEDGDITARVLLHGYQVYETDTAKVLHYGFRAHRDGRDLARRDWVGIGAAYAKPLKCGHWRFVIVPLYELFAVAIGLLLADVIKFTRPRGFTRVSAFLLGFAKGFSMPVDRTTGRFQAR